jgi:hydrogenase maturation protein HypF
MDELAAKTQKNGGRDVGISRVKMAVRRQIEVSGIVQGVGFRPYAYRLATERHLSGTIRNTSSGVTIEVQGPAEAIADFTARLPQEAPPLSRITDIAFVDVPCEGISCNGDSEFRILASQGEEAVRTLISPDVATCGDCLREMFDPGDRRYRYPFINCTNCGPRFTIVRDIPYDRPRTSMSVFKMCPACQTEYDNPLDRRFHAQPNACWDCGPTLEFSANQERRITHGDPIAATITALNAGLVVAVKGLGGFHLAADATNPAAVALLRERKRRVGKPFAIMVPNLKTAERLCEISQAEKKVLESIERPIVLLRRKSQRSVAAEVAPGNSYLGVFLPYTPLHHLLLREGEFEALVMTSGNMSEEPIAIANDEARTRLSGLADYFLVHNRDILLRCDDSVVRVVGAETQQLRRSRGFVPVPVFLREEVPSVLAVGGELKNTICLTQGKHAFLSQHVGDLENLESYKFFEEAIKHLQKVLEIRPEIVAYDLHQDYFSTKWALRQADVSLVGVQHHHAHIASCMAENHLDGTVIGFALDGTGYGSDGNIWGGEVLVASYQGFERAAHFEYVHMPGGSAAIHEPWRMAVSYLTHHFGSDFLDRKIPTATLPFLEKIGRRKLDLLLHVIERRVNSPLTSSCGRLFDAVAAIADIRQQVTYEAQAAIELEMLAGNSTSDEAYTFELLPARDGWIIGTKQLFEALIEDVASNRPVAEISRRFHNGLVQIFGQVAHLLRERTSLNRVCLSGGTFNNLYLTERLSSQLLCAGFEVFTQNEVPAGDGGLSLGQAMVAANVKGED